MRKQQKKEIMEMIQTLHEAHDEIKSYIENNSIPVAQDLLQQCQDCAISIGTAIEKFEGEGFVTVSHIEGYCDIVFQIYQELNESSKPNSNKLSKKLRQQLLKIENSVEHDVPVKKVVVFLPYKASMWDSLESVWKAADADPNCEAYVVPIPYYDKNPDGSMREFHYEIDQYPDYVPVTHCEKFDFVIHPDEIYIHNPYDDWNIVTTVPEFFYSSNLLKFTDKLVYIPYFVLSEPANPDDIRSLEGMAHFATTPGVVNAHQVIVQSENMKRAYVTILTNTYGENTRATWEKKILGTGSPKFDKVKNTKKEDITVPEEWLKIIQKPDGSWKKIIFYNNSIAALLENSEKMITKMQDVFRIFYENKDEIALLWRPHPLIQATLTSMRPQLWQEYDILVRKYREDGWGIYDDTADLDRAIALSDAYYGDQSSVVQLCREKGMPVMIQNADVIES